MSEVIPKKSSIPIHILNDLSSRFIINVPQEERTDLTRLCFQIELAHWFYLDFYCDEDNSLTRISLNQFIHIIFGHIPFLQKYDNDQVQIIISEWREYKKVVPTFGAILLDHELKNVLLVQSFVSKASWSFPKGKVNKDERPHQCAIREVFEEIGFDITGLIDEEQYLEYNLNDQMIRLYVVPHVPRETKFKPRTRKEIKDIKWFLIDELPITRDTVTSDLYKFNNFFVVSPFIRQLKKWIIHKYPSMSREEPKMLEMDKEMQKQQILFSQLTKRDYAKHMGIKESSSSAFKSIHNNPSQTYSSPPRLKQNRNQQQKTDKIHGRVFTASKSYDPDQQSNKKSAVCNDDEDWFPNPWQDFHLNIDALMETFTSSLRKTSPSISTLIANAK